MSLSVDLDETYIYDIGLSCADPGIFVRGGGGVGVQVNLTKKALTTFLFSPQLILQSQMVNFKENYRFSRFLRGSNIFQGEGGPTFSGRGGGFQLLIPIENI